MKKKIFSLLAALVLCLGLLVLPPAASAAGNPCFMALNNTLLELEDQYIPIVVSGLYYVPYTIFDNTLTSINLGVYPTMNAGENTLSLYSRQEFLTFNLDVGTCVDRDGQVYKVRAVNRNGRIYLPARFVSEFFGLSYSSMTTQYGPMVRISSSPDVLSDAGFADAASMLMEGRLANWQRAQAAANTPTVTPTPNPVPTPSPTPTPASPSGPDQPPDRSDVRAFLAVRHTGGQGLDALLNTLDRAEVCAVFFFPADSLADCDEAVRQVLCRGHTVGLLVSGTTGAELTAAAAEGNRLLARIARLETPIILAGEAPADALDAAEAGGLLCWRGNVNAQPDGRTYTRRAAEVLEAAGAFRYEVRLTLDDSAAGAVLAGAVLQGLTESRYNLRPAVETEF